jgi:hypothetical protein
MTPWRQTGVLGCVLRRNAPGVWTTRRRAVSGENNPMATSASEQVSSIGRRTIDGERYHRAATEDMTVAFDAPGIATVDHAGETYQVELESGACQYDDYRFRGESIVCKHAQRAALAALFDGEQRVTELVARVACFARTAGHSVRGCEGPTTRGKRGLPCQSCIDAVRSESVNEYTVWTRLCAPEGRP